MSFSYSVHGLCCDFCDHDKSTRKNIYKINCPYGWCQAWAVCDLCRRKGLHKNSSCGFPNDPKKQNHKYCKNMIEVNN